MFRTESKNLTAPEADLPNRNLGEVSPPRSWIQPIDHLKLWKVDTWLINKTIDFKSDKI